MFAAKQGSSKKPRSFSGIEAETTFAKPLFAKKCSYANSSLIYLALFANPVESIFTTSFLVQILALAIFNLNPYSRTYYNNRQNRQRQ